MTISPTAEIRSPNGFLAELTTIFGRQIHAGLSSTDGEISLRIWGSCRNCLMIIWVADRVAAASTLAPTSTTVMKSRFGTSEHISTGNDAEPYSTK